MSQVKSTDKHRPVGPSKSRRPFTEFCLLRIINFVSEGPGRRTRTIADRDIFPSFLRDICFTPNRSQQRNRFGLCQWQCLYQLTPTHPPTQMRLIYCHRSVFNEQHIPNSSTLSVCTSRREEERKNQWQTGVKMINLSSSFIYKFLLSSPAVRSKFTSTQIRNHNVKNNNINHCNSVEGGNRDSRVTCSGNENSFDIHLECFLGFA